MVSEGRAGGPSCWLGSIKTNLGHLEAAAGVAGLIKAVLCLKHRQIPPHLHLKNPNPKIAFDELNLRLARQLEDWNQSEGPRLATN